MSLDSFKYILRFTIQPQHHEEERLDSLVRFCKQALIDDVMFFADCEELNTGHIDLKELEPWLSLMIKAKERLSPLGITLSINPWTTLLHGDRGRKLKSGQEFTLMVDRKGRKATAQACPLCPEWRKYIVDIYQQYATIKPDMIWVEDDFRFHNHSPLDWGGCFCDRHMAEYSKQADKPLSREEFTAGILQPGEPHPYRKIWLDCCRETMVENARLIGDGVHAVSPDTKVGLMSSIPAVHCAEDRDWHGILKGLASGGRPVNRPALMCYTEVTPQNYLLDFSAVACQTRALVPADTLTYPELDNGPFSLFNESLASTRLQLETSVFLCAEGITMSLFNMIGTGVNFSEGFQTLLADSKPFLNQVRSLDLQYCTCQGVTIPVSPKSSHVLQTLKGTEMTELYPQETFWACLTAAFGLAFRYSHSKSFHHEIVAVAGQYLRNLSHDEILALFCDNLVILDGEAAYTLFQMGHGDLLKISNVQWHEMESAYQTYEEVRDGIHLFDIANARSTAMTGVGDYAEIDYAGEVDTLTTLRDYAGHPVGHGLVRTKHGHLIYPFGRFNGRIQAHLNPFRRELLLQSIREMKYGVNVFFVEESPYITLAVFKKDNGYAIMISNFSNDPAPTITLRLPSPVTVIEKILFRNTGVDVKNAIINSNSSITIPQGLDRMETMAVVYS